jgi:1-deoxy-D-xylulose-5-phosphate reductoisomerase
MTGVAILGATGSIGRQTLEVIAALGDRFSVRGLAAGRHGEAFSAQLAAWPDAMAWSAAGPPADLPPRRWADGGLVELATADGVDLVVVATTGMAALEAVLAGLRSGRRVALANKETLVTGGHLVEAVLETLGGDRLDRLRPIDSEHSAIWQCLVGERTDAVTRLVLTASGGPFRGRSATSLASVTPAEALAHPTWRMGPKITIDSATLVNKAFEAIEAKWLYAIPYSKIDAVIHPQSVVHSLVEFRDGSYKAQLGLPDMRLPIQYALTYPEHLASPAPRVDLTDLPHLTFEAPDLERFPGLRIGREAGRRGPRASAALIAADDVAVERFMNGTLDFGGIAALCADAVDHFGDGPAPELEELIALDAEVRVWAAAATATTAGASTN